MMRGGLTHLPCMSILVTGGAGFIGSNFVHYWLKKHPSDPLVVLDSLTYAGCRANLPASHPSLNFVQGNICDAPLLETVFRDFRVSKVVHFAAESHVDRSIKDPEAFVQTNVIGTYRLLEAARQAWAKNPHESHRFHHVSTDEVYGSLSASDPAFSEKTPYAPNSPYSASKAASDHLVRSYYHTYHLPVTTSNCSNNYGPYHFPEKLIPLILVNILHGKPLPIYGDGLNVRDWLYVEDHCRGIDLVITKGRSGEVYNIGGNNERTNIEIVQTICDLVATEFSTDESLRGRFPACPQSPRGLITYVPDRPGHDRRYAIDATKARVELGYEPLETLESGLRKTVRWYLDNEIWWRAVMDGTYQNWISTNYEAR
jgi:dTDP-glucose 4,6-dehydratase